MYPVDLYEGGPVRYATPFFSNHLFFSRERSRQDGVVAGSVADGSVGEAAVALCREPGPRAAVIVY